MTKPEIVAPVDINLLEFLKGQGLGEQIAAIEKHSGINLSRIEEAASRFITKDPACKAMLIDARRLVTHDDPVLIQGESGTGKEIIANLLHAGRKAGRFVAVNVSALPKELVESILFGYTKGTFTGASTDREGLIQYAQEGTLFLDEIGDLPYDMQCKFLRVMQERKVRRVGATEEEPVKCRFIAATHHNLRENVTSKQFRLDLYARLSTFELLIPPLRMRLHDIPAICESIDKSFPHNKVDWSKIDLSLNVRSIQQIIRRYAVLGRLPDIKTSLA